MIGRLCSMDILRPNLERIAIDFGPKVSSLSRRMISNRAVAEEAAQEAWVEIVRSWKSFRGDSAVSTWVYTVARRTILRHANKEGVYGRDELNAYYAENPIDIPGNADPEKEAWVKESCDHCLTAMLHCLNPEDRLLYLFRDVIPLPYSELSRIFGVEVATLRKRVSRANKKMEAYLTQQCRLVNHEDSCTCTIRQAVDDVDLSAEYDKVHAVIKETGRIQAIGGLLPSKNYWLALLTTDVAEKP